MNLGQNAKMPRRLIEQAVVKHLGGICKSRGIQVPGDDVDFLNRARVHFLDVDGHEIDLDHVMVIWENG